MNIKTANELVGGLSQPSKMPCWGYGLPISSCKIGAQLRRWAPASTCHSCYAGKGRYVFPNVIKAQIRRLASLNNPEWAEAMSLLINSKQSTFFRWHDSGDLQGLDHLIQIADVCRHTPTVAHWLPTREIATVKSYLAKYPNPSNLTIRISGNTIDGPTPPHLRGTQTSTVTRSTPTCPAHEQGNECKTCRKCWDPKVLNVSYPWH
jgi:hypothetical protein